jgi:hypothetical protein
MNIKTYFLNSNDLILYALDISPSRVIFIGILYWWLQND